MTSCVPERVSLRRHAFAWCSAEAARDTLVRDWLSAGRPLVVRRPCADATRAFLGLALPPDQGKKRIPCEVPLGEIRRVEPPPLWRDCAVASDVRSALEPLSAACDSVGLPLRTFGSTAWQHLTGLRYITPESDADLLVDVPDRDAWRVLCDAAMAIEWPCAPRVDWEIVLRGDAAFAWREFCQPGERLLFKGNSRVWLGCKADIEELL